MTVRTAVGAGIVAIVLTSLLGCASAAASVEQRFESAHVTVNATIEAAPDGTTTLAVRFEPMESGIHLYGSEMPVGGIDGAGRPTRVEVDDAAWTASAASTASVESILQPIAGFETPFPVYPDGPVTIRVPIGPTTIADTDQAVDIRVTFMACTSSGLCYVPVERAPISVPMGNRT